MKTNTVLLFSIVVIFLSFFSSVSAIIIPEEITIINSWDNIDIIDDGGSGNVYRVASNGRYSKYNKDGQQIWSHEATLDTELQVYSYGFSVDGNEDLYTYGFFSKSSDEGNMELFGVINPVPARYGTYYSSYMAKFSGDDGSLIFLKTTNHFLRIKSLFPAADGSLYIGGTFSNTSNAFGVAIDTTPSNSNNKEFFVAKLDSEGNGIWAKASGARVCNTDYRNSIIVKANNSFVYALGTTCAGETLFGKRHTGHFDYTGYNSDVFFSKFSLNGVVEAAERIGTSKKDNLFDFELSKKDNGVYIIMSVIGCGSKWNWSSERQFLAFGRRQSMKCIGNGFNYGNQDWDERGLVFVKVNQFEEPVSIVKVAKISKYSDPNSHLKMASSGILHWVHSSASVEGQLDVFGLQKFFGQYSHSTFYVKLRDLDIEDIGLNTMVNNTKVKIAAVSMQEDEDLVKLKIKTSSGIKAVLALEENNLLTSISANVYMVVDGVKKILLDYDKIILNQFNGMVPPEWSTCRHTYPYIGGVQQMACSCYPPNDVSMRYCAESPLDCTGGQSPSWNSDTEEYECAYTYAWEYSSWNYSVCSASGDISGTRSVVCKNSGGDVAADSYCGKVRRKPDAVRVLTCGKWLASEWGTCQDHVKTRDLSCVHKDTNIPLPDEKCPSINRISNTNNCQSVCVLGTARHDSGWSQCYRVGQHYGGRAFKMVCNDGTYYITEYESIRCSGRIQSGPRVFGR